MNGKQHVTDADIAAEIRRVAPGGTQADVRAAAEVVCWRLGSRDDHHAVAAFNEVLDRAELISGGDLTEDSRAERNFIRGIQNASCSDVAVGLLRAYGRQRASTARRERDEKWAKAARGVIEIFAPEEHDCVCALAALLKKERV